MYWIALSLGFFGSLHCIGMCGPLAIAVHSHKHKKGFEAFFDTIQYNVGRTIGYIILGLLFGMLGSIVFLGGGQKILSILLGFILITVFFLSSNLDQLILKIDFIKNFYETISNKLLHLFQKSARIPSFLLGVVNGFLPCGLVYLAIAGSMSISNIWGGAGFMLFFAIGTFPAMIGLTMGQHLLKPKLRLTLNKIYPYITLLMGIYLLYRGLMSKLPLELDFYEALKNPVLCH